MALNVLIVDDSSIMRKIILKTLKDSGLLICDVFEAENGKQGISILTENEVDFILLDINMPVMNGIEMFESIRKDPKTEKTPVVFVSSDSNQNRIDLLESKGAEFVHKPFNAKCLGQVVKKMVSDAKR